MPNVFLSYDHEDYARAAPIAAALEAHGHSVWWDRQIRSGAEFNTEIESAVQKSDAVVVLWSEKSIHSAWVRDEAAEGRDGGKLIPVLIDPVKPPMGFRQYQTLNLSRWTGGKRIPQMSELLDAIGKGSKANSTAGLERPAEQPRRFPTMPVETSRRPMLIGGVAAAAAVIGGGVWWSLAQSEDPRFKKLIEQSEEAIRHETADEQTARMLEHAVSMQPNSTKALGLLALVKSQLALGAGPRDAPTLVQGAEGIARRALSIDSHEPNALLAMFELQGATLDWFTRDQRLRQIVGIDPGNVIAIAELTLLTQSVGYVRESNDWNERALALEPLSANFLGRRALKRWFLGRTSEADKVVDQVRALYPNDPWLWFVRMHIYLFTGRVSAARAMVDEDPDARDHPQLTGIWRTSIAALDQPTPENISRAREACVNGAEMSPLFATEAVLIMCALRDVDTAFDIANAFLLARGPLAGKKKPGRGEPEVAWRIACQWMFTPPAGVMRSDPRFLPLCDGIGLADYWRRRGVRPDYQRA